MRPPLTLPLLLALIALAGPAGAQIKTNAGAEASAGTAGSVGSSLNAGGVAPIGLSGRQVSPLSLSGALSPALAAPAASPQQGLAASALLPSARPAAAAAEKPGPLRPAAAPPTPADEGAAAAPAAPPGSPPVFFLFELAKFGVPEGLRTRLYDFLADRHPGDQNKVYHGLGHSREVANLAARLVAGQDLSAEKKILLILAAALHDVDPERADNTPARVSATLAHLDGNDEARALLLDFGGAYGFTAAQVKALIMATDFDLDPAKMKDKQDAFAQAAAAAFPEPAWALAWGKRLAFADQSSSYVGTPAQARQRVEGLALEIRTQLQAIGKGPGPSDEMILAGTYKFLSGLRKEGDMFALLPPEQRKNFDAVLRYFEGRQTPEAWQGDSAPMPARAPPVNPDPAAARRFIAGIMGGLRAPTERETDSLLGDWLDENGIPKDSPRAAAVRRELLPAKASADAAVAASLHPKLRGHAALLIRLASENEVTVAHIEAVMAKRGLLGLIDAVPASSLEGQIELALTNDELDRAVAGYPDNPQGDLMRAVAGTMATKGGKSVEEISRDGVFLYADFSGSAFMRGYASRDPDIQSHTIAFYVTRADGKWRIDGYRQKKSSRTSDLAYIDGLKSWLRKGGIPSSDLL